jgi:hypothetical protein
MKCAKMNELHDIFLMMRMVTYDAITNKESMFRYDKLGVLILQKKAQSKMRKHFHACKQCKTERKELNFIVKELLEKFPISDEDLNRYLFGKD